VCETFSSGDPADVARENIDQFSLATGLTLNGSLDVTYPLPEVSSAARVFDEFRLSQASAGTTVKITMTSTDFPPEILLFDRDPGGPCPLLASNAATNGGTTAEVIFTVGARQPRMVFTSVNGAPGTYSVRTRLLVCGLETEEDPPGSDSSFFIGSGCAGEYVADPGQCQTDLCFAPGNGREGCCVSDACRATAGVSTLSVRFIPACPL